jgi:CRP-like cAMP-binding protein
VPVRAQYFVLEGRVQVDSGSAKPKILGPHDVVGGLGALSGDALGQHAVALEDTFALQLDREDMEEVFEDNFPIFLGVLRVLARTLVASEKELGRAIALRPENDLPFDAGGELGLVERILLLRGSMNFAGAEIEALADLAQESELFELPADGPLWQVGDAAQHGVLLATGRVRGKAADHDPFWFEPGAVVGGVDALSNEPRWYAATAETPVRGLRLQTQNLLDVIEDNMAVGMNLLRVIARGIRDVSERIEIR